MVKREARYDSVTPSPSKRAKLATSAPAKSEDDDDGDDLQVLGKGRWRDWPAPLEQIEAARDFFREW